MQMDRLYKQALPFEGMLAELRQGAGTQFDPSLAALARAWCVANRRILPVGGLKESLPSLLPVD